jgi:hypothetical protein
MLFNTIVLSALATSALAFPYNVEKRTNSRKQNDPQANLPACGPNTVTCKCPANSFYQTSSSYAFWPVPASEITRLSVNFLDTAWFGTSPESTEGNGTTVGAKRHLRAQLPEGKNIDLITEELTQLTHYPDGGYYMKFQMADAPFWYEKTGGKKGLLAGSWDIVEVRNINNVAYMLWDIHVCFMDSYGE